MNRKPILSLLLCLCVFLCTPLSCFCSAAEQYNGTVRVLLTRPELTDTVTLSLDGSYSLDDLLFQRGCRLTVSCASGSLIVYYEGMSLQHGKELLLTRHTVRNGENGLRFNGGYDLYTGSLKITVSDGMLRAVLYAPLEEYLNGVVPYEMSDSFPLEALKVQAICARTYAMKKVTEGGGKEWDLYDNTNDQVYIGTRAENVNAARAIRETEGVCGFYGSSLADCWYTASNGGQTEDPLHAWNESRPYLKITDDPYDTANPDSVTKSAVLPKNASDPAFPAALKTLLTSGIAGSLSMKGYSENPEDMRILSVEDIRLTDPMYPGTASLLMQTACFTVTAEGRKIIPEDDEIYLFSTPEPTVTPSPDGSAPLLGAFTRVPGSFTVKLPVYGMLEKLWGISINSRENEIWRIEEQEDCFTVSASRSGHGVGMSQRGAQWMALADKKTAQEILSFYFPGVSFRRISVSSPIASPVNAVFLITPGPAATPTPRPTVVPLSVTPAPGQYSVIVDGIQTNSSLNLRAAPSASATILRTLYWGQRLLVLDKSGEWLHVSADGIEGYVMGSFVSIEK